ncbi:MAG: T9SS type A sorting domain-containing protein [Bacteroidetes bacterium]|nr:T9SS type A sorting domain-containing protein [Bacteroidota bacterium]
MASIENFSLGELLTTSDSGKTWTHHVMNGTNVGNLGGIAIMNDSVLFTGDQHLPGMAISKDGGNTSLTGNLFISIDRIHALDSTNLIGSGRTIYKFHPDTMLASIPSTPNITHEFQLTVNNDELFLSMLLFRRTKVMMELFSADGKFSSQPIKNFYAHGDNIESINVSHLAQGAYFVVIRTNEGHFGKRFIIDRK